jgi:hypothetical protein
MEYNRSMNNPIARARALYDKGSRENIVQFLQEMDPNGSWTDEASYAEGLEPLTYDEALLELEDMIKELEAVPA